MVRWVPVVSGLVSPDFSGLLDVVVALLVADSVFDDVVSAFFSSVLVAEPHPTSARLKATVAIPTPVAVVTFLVLEGVVVLIGVCVSFVGSGWKGSIRNL